MFSLSRSMETKYLENGTYKYIIGADEAGRGPLAGPVVAAACYIPSDVQLDGITDSKATKESDRELTYESIISNHRIRWAVSIISHTEIDEINILEASLKGMNQAIESVLEKLKSSSSKDTMSEKDFLALIDGNKLPKNMSIASKYIIKGDSIIYSIAAASIIAKVTRDRIMIELSKQYPQYNLDKHKGYPTLEHRQTLLRLGPTPIHRFSYTPVRIAAEKHNQSQENKQDSSNLDTKTFSSDDNNMVMNPSIVNRKANRDSNEEKRMKSFKRQKRESSILLNAKETVDKKKDKEEENMNSSRLRRSTRVRNQTK